jgi:hypothetical protein
MVLDKLSFDTSRRGERAKAFAWEHLLHSARQTRRAVKEQLHDTFPTFDSALLDRMFPLQPASRNP